MAQYGALGPAGALGANLPLPPSPEQPRTLELVACGLMSPEGHKAPQYVWLKALFKDAVHGDVRPLGRAEFVAFARQHWGATPTDAHKWFMASDVDKSGRLNLHEFALLRQDGAESLRVSYGGSLVRIVRRCSFLDARRASVRGTSSTRVERAVDCPSSTRVE